MIMKTLNKHNSYSSLVTIGARTTLSADCPFPIHFTRTRLSALRTLIWLMPLLCLSSLSLSAQPGTNSAKAVVNPPAEGSKVVASEAGASVAATPAESSDTNLVTMNFHGAPLDQVLNHLSETAGFIINIKPGATVRGKVDAWSAKPMTKEEALNLLDSALYQNGLGALRNGRTLTIVKQEEIKTQNNPVIQGSDPDKIPMSDRVVTQRSGQFHRDDRHAGQHP